MLWGGAYTQGSENIPDAYLGFHVAHWKKRMMLWGRCRCNLAKRQELRKWKEVFPADGEEKTWKEESISFGDNQRCLCRVWIQTPEYADMTSKITVIGEAIGSHLSLNVTLVSQQIISRHTKSTIRNTLIPMSEEMLLEVKHLNWIPLTTQNKNGWPQDHPNL